LHYIIEIATTDFLTTQAAIEGGADRIELCASLAEGGITPSAGLIKQVKEKFGVPVFPIIRPRGGDFLYTDDEFRLMITDITIARQLGCEGVVVGILSDEGNIDIARTAALVDLAYPMEVTFHRAFDRCADPFTALEQLIEIGCQRILTSGQQPAAPEGIEMISELFNQANDRIIIMPGSGVRKENIKMLATRSGATEFHSSLRGKQRSKMKFLHPAFQNSEESFTNSSIDPGEVLALRNALLA
jgi:copper homeostasis protein